MAGGEGKTRRRFLADLLFLGGGLTATAILAQNLRTQEPATCPATPTPEGNLAVPTPLEPPQPKGKVAIPDGDYVQPPTPEAPPPAVKGEYSPPAQSLNSIPEPVIEGRRAEPR